MYPRVIDLDDIPLVEVAREQIAVLRQRVEELRISGDSEGARILGAITLWRENALRKIPGSSKQ